MGFKLKKLAGKALKKFALPITTSFIPGGGFIKTASSIISSSRSKKSKANKQPQVGGQSALRPQAQTTEDTSSGFSPTTSGAGPAIASAGGCGATGGDWQVIIPTVIAVYLLYNLIWYSIRIYKNYVKK